jgi:hypothetical protein
MTQKIFARLKAGYPYGNGTQSFNVNFDKFNWRVVPDEYQEQAVGIMKDADKVKEHILEFRLGDEEPKPVPVGVSEEDKANAEMYDQMEKDAEAKEAKPAKGKRALIEK